MILQNVKRACLALAVAATLTQTAVADQTYSTIKERGVVRIGVNLSGLPFGTYATGTQRPIGFAVELA
jgi:ABC-type amino acid transport substrate-binding protein